MTIHTHTQTQRDQPLGLIYNMIHVFYITCMFRTNSESCFTAGKATTDEELEEMLDGGNAAVFTAGVGTILYTSVCQVLLSRTFTIRRP